MKELGETGNMTIPAYSKTYCCLAKKDDIRGNEELKKLLLSKPKDVYIDKVLPGVLKNKAGNDPLDVNFVIYGTGAKNEEKKQEKKQSKL